MGKVVPLICILGLFVAAPAQAKGPDRATLTGPGLERPLVFSHAGTPSLGVLTQKGGFWVQAFGAAAGAGQGEILAARPTGDLGPR